MTSRPWAILGSSPTAQSFLPELLDGDPIVATCNAGIYLVETPDFFGSFEVDVPKWFATAIARARKRGTKVVTSTAALRNAPWLKPEIVLPCEAASGETQFRRGHYTASKSGAMMLQLAVNTGAKSVRIAGCEGYATTPGNRVVDTFDGRHGPLDGERDTRCAYGPLMQAIITECPDVEFIFYGKPRYPLRGENLIVQRYSATPQSEIEQAVDGVREE